MLAPTRAAKSPQMPPGQAAAPAIEPYPGSQGKEWSRLENSQAQPGTVSKQAYMRKIQWYGLKTHVKRLLGARALNCVLVPVWRTASGMVAPQQTWRFPVNRRCVRGMAAGKSFRMLYPMRCSIAKELYWNDGLREVPADRFALDLFCQLARTSDLVFDIGANTGIFTLAAAVSNLAIEIHAFEIVPEIVLHLVSNLVENELLSRVEVHAYGIGSAETVIRVPSQARSSALPTALSSKVPFSEGASVAFRTLDEQISLARHASHVLLKIDVEGTENEILRHGSSFLARLSPDILCEILPHESDVREVASHLKANQYRTYKILEDRVQFQSELNADPAYHDWLFTRLEPSELAGKISPLQVAK